MASFTFKGGIHPYDGKELSKDKPMKRVLPKGELAYPLSQHIGAPASPAVAVGDRVLVGQKIADAGGFVSSPVHASVSGTVKAIEPRFVATGAKVNSIIVENDGLYEEVEYHVEKPVEEMTQEEILDSIKAAGVVGMGGAGFPTHIKLSPKDPEAIDYVIVNCAECEPYLTSDYRRMVENPDWLVDGLKIILRLFDNAKGILAVEDNKPEAITALQKLCAGEPRIQVKALKTKYPQGAERMLIYACTGRQLNSSMLPADVGCVVDNVETVTAIYQGVALGKPVIHKIVTVTGEAIADPRNFLVCTGMDISELIEEAGGFREEPAKILSGGPMMGNSLFELHIPVTKTSSSLLCMTRDDVARFEPTACINCGRCVDACPEHLVPSRLANFAEHGNEEAFLKYNGMECCECGCCSYICPAKRPLTQAIKSYRRGILANRRK